MDTTIVSLLATATGERGLTFLGEDFVGWRTALIAAVPAAVIYEVLMALTRRVTLRLPFLVLYTARIGVPKDAWKAQYAEWRSELWFLLRDRETYWLLRFIKGMSFAIPLALGGARLAARAAADATPTRTLLRLLKPSRVVVVTGALVGGTGLGVLVRLFPGLPVWLLYAVVLTLTIAITAIKQKAGKRWDLKVERMLNGSVPQSDPRK
ncbi:hypothetical protein [Streptomyces sp. NPDC058891]|uniref:hypothetical protein n=1 Tax=Streptomyces sp. NPDC058891 TaxID=3346667 RepID=UPI0036B851CF